MEIPHNATQQMTGTQHTVDVTVFVSVQVLWNESSVELLHSRTVEPSFHLRTFWSPSYQSVSLRVQPQTISAASVGTHDCTPDRYWSMTVNCVRQHYAKSQKAQYSQTLHLLCGTNCPRSSHAIKCYMQNFFVGGLTVHCTSSIEEFGVIFGVYTGKCCGNCGFCVRQYVSQFI